MYLVDNSVVSNPDAIETSFTFQFFAFRRARVLREFINT